MRGWSGRRGACRCPSASRSRGGARTIGPAGRAPSQAAACALGPAGSAAGTGPDAARRRRRRRRRRRVRRASPCARVAHGRLVAAGRRGAAGGAGLRRRLGTAPKGASDGPRAVSARPVALFWNANEGGAARCAEGDVRAPAAAAGEDAEAVRSHCSPLLRPIPHLLHLLLLLCRHPPPLPLLHPPAPRVRAGVRAPRAPEAASRARRRRVSRRRWRPTPRRSRCRRCRRRSAARRRAQSRWRGDSQRR